MNKWTVFYLLLSLLFFQACSSAKFGMKSMQKQEVSLLQQLEDEEKCFSGFILFDPMTKDTLVAYHHNKYFTPASNTKIYTFYSAISKFGDSIPSFKYLETDTALHIFGLPDPSLLNPHIQESDRFVDFLDNYEMPILLYFPNQEQLKLFGPGWSWDDYNYYYQTERTPMPLYGNSIHITHDSIHRWRVFPPNDFDVEIILDTSLSTMRAYSRDMASNKFLVKLRDIPAKDFHLEIPIHWDNDLIVNFLDYEINQPVSFGYSSFDRNLWLNAKQFYNVHADSLYIKLMQDSDNFIAEQLLLSIAVQETDTLWSRRAIQSVINNELTSLPDEIRWLDGSGLSRYNLTTPRNTIHVLDLIFEEIGEKRIIDIFPAGGQSGTIEHLYGNPSSPYVFAKTGTLSNKHALSGYIITNSGRRLIFSFMHENYINGTKPVKTKMDEILRFIKQSY